MSEIHFIWLLGCAALTNIWHSSTHAPITVGLSKQVLQSFVVSIVLTRLDYGSATLAGLPYVLLDWLQSVLHAAVRLIYSARKYDHVTPLLRDLHWLRVPERIAYHKQCSHFAASLSRTSLPRRRCPGHDGKLQPHRVNILPYRVWDLACWW